MFKKHKFLIIGVALLAVAAVLIFVFKDKIFKPKQTDTGSDQNPVLPTPNTSTPKTQTQSEPENLNHNVKVGDKVYSSEKQSIQRVKIWDGIYHTYDKDTGKAYGSGAIGKGSLIGVIEKDGKNGWFYVKGASNLSFPYYLVHNSKMYVK